MEGEPKEELPWCVVANVRMVVRSGRHGEQERVGLPHFPGGAKVWMLPPQWGDGGEKVLVVGYHRSQKARGPMRFVVPRIHLENFRIKPVYSPTVRRALTAPRYGGRPTQWRDRADAQQAVDFWNAIACAIDGVSWTNRRLQLIWSLQGLTRNADEGGTWWGYRTEVDEALGILFRDERELAAFTALRRMFDRMAERHQEEVSGISHPDDPAWPALLATATGLLELLMLPSEQPARTAPEDVRAVTHRD